MASSIIHDKDISNDTLDDYLLLIYENSQDKQNIKALLLAHDLKNNGSKIQV